MYAKPLIPDPYQYDAVIQKAFKKINLWEFGCSYLTLNHIAPKEEDFYHEF